MKAILTSLLLACGLLAGSQAGAQALTSPLDSIVAVVEEDVILRTELDTAVSNILAQYRDRADQLPPRNVLEKQVLERLILMRLQLQRAESGGIRIADNEVDQAVFRIAEQNRITVDQMRQQLARDGLTFAEFRDSLKDEMTVQRLRQNVVQSRVNVSDTEIDIALASNAMKQGQIRVGLILIAIPEGATQEQIELGRTKAEGVRDLLKRGEISFDAAAIRYSDAPNALEGGDLGWRSFDEVPPMFASVLQGMKKGDISQPIRNTNGYHILGALDTRESGQNTVTEYNARDILVKITEVVDANEAKSRIEAILGRIKAGEDFGEVAREVSEDGLTRSAGGDMGWFQPYEWGTAVGEQLLSLKDGEVSEPFRSDIGWHLVQRLGTRVQDTTEQTLRERARDSIARRKAESEFESFLRQLRDESYVETRLKS